MNGLTTQGDASINHKPVAEAFAGEPQGDLLREKTVEKSWTLPQFHPGNPPEADCPQAYTVPCGIVIRPTACAYRQWRGGVPMKTGDAKKGQAFHKRGFPWN